MVTAQQEGNTGGFDVPILFVIFNRADTAAQVFEQIRAIRPKKLYVAADGARPAKAGEKERCDETRAVIQVDWPCDLKTLYSDENLGCRRNMSGAISWMFESEESGIILEDDCITSPVFFPYCRELLQRYAQDPRVMMVCGSNFEFGKRPRQTSYHFSHLAHVWGWATWRRAWAHFDLAIPAYESFVKGDWLARFCGSKRVADFWLDRFRGCREGTVDAWSYAWIAAIWSQNGLTTLPSANLVSNIGFGQGATNTKRKYRFAEMPLSTIPYPLVHPEFLMPDLEADAETSREQYILRNVWEKAVRRAKWEIDNLVKRDS